MCSFHCALVVFRCVHFILLWYSRVIVHEIDSLQDINATPLESLLR